ncbi:serine/threonine-protein kinase Nek4-like [Eriocheir sinensis]|uniref:serine/threonine-protein kinase Nek4-like n=1 Tax=Eriocheir sinensis TaxID=95602 RepID=UPI0021C93CA2|nr:serine/threonine-protein kinase Nek4-like [Eriocheir sinensis]
MEVNMNGRFKKLTSIGRGTFGEAWLVVSTCSGRRYVMKEVRMDDLSEEEVEKTRLEAEVLARCRHASIVRYKECFMRPSPATMCLVMEYADGGDLSQRVSEARRHGVRLDESVVLDWFVQIVLAVQYLHANNILHRDLKTQNIFLTQSNLVKVGDFGIARLLQDRQDLATTTIGTPFYLSPEICKRRPYNHKSDMWALGCVLYELCALRQPFHALTFDRLVNKILQGAYEPMPESYSSLVQDLTRILLRTVPERRPSAGALLTLPGLTPYVQGYLERYEESLGKREHEDKDSPALPLAAPPPPVAAAPLRKDPLEDPPHLARLKDRSRQKRKRGSVDLGSLNTRQGGKGHWHKEDTKSNPRNRCSSDSCLRPSSSPPDSPPVPSAPPSSPSSPSPPLSPHARGLPTPPASPTSGNDGVFVSPLPRQSRRRPDTPWPRLRNRLSR